MPELESGTERHVSGTEILEEISSNFEERVEKYLENRLDEVVSTEDETYDFDVWTASGSHAAVSYREGDGSVYLDATGGMLAVDTALDGVER